MTLNLKSLLEAILILNIDKQIIGNVCEGEEGFILDRGMYESLTEQDPAARTSRS